MDDPLTVWYCDVCGEPIVNKEDGNVIWQTKKQMKAYDFKIVHRGRCDIQSYLWSPLRNVLGSKGLAYLLTFLSIGPIKIRNGERSSNSDIIDYDEFVDFFRRVQTPYYEEARRCFNNEKLLDDFSDNNELFPYISENLKSIIERYSSIR